MNKRITAAAIISFMAAYQLQGHASGSAVYSGLWGKNGEKWNPVSRLPDFSYAGYHFGEDPLPDIESVTDVTDFGAKGDGKTDCTGAFIQAVEATDRGAITIPPGRYVIHDILRINKPNIVLRGAGPGKTVLYFPRPLSEVRPVNRSDGLSGYSASGGLIWVEGTIEPKPIAPIVAEAKRGEKTIMLRDSDADLKKGQRVVVELQDDREKSLMRYLYSGDPGDISAVETETVMMVNRVVSVDGSRVILERPLRHDIRASWKPFLKTFEPDISEVGIENLSIAFPPTPYDGHTFQEIGWNAIHMRSVSDCWIRNVRLSNCDGGILFKFSHNCTVDGVVLDASRKPAGREGNEGTTGHHGITMGEDCVVQNFDYQTRFIHDITLGYRRAGNVIKNGQGINLSFDHHRKAPHENLFCNIDVGRGDAIWTCGGKKAIGKHAGAYNTFWCIRSRNELKLPPEDFGPDSLNLVGLNMTGESVREENGRWIEIITPGKLEPADLHAAQLEKRLQRMR